MNIAVGIGMILIYIGGLAYFVFSNPLPKQDFEEFAVGGRSFGWPFITMTLIGTWYAGSFFTGWAPFSYDIGITSSYMMIYTLGALFILYIIGGRLWKLGKKYNLKTMGQYFELRYESRSLRIFVGLVLLLVEFPWVITELLASGYAVQAITYQKIPFNVGMSLIAVFFIIYVVFAGMRAVITADYYQGWIFLIGGITLFLVTIFYFFDGIPDMFAKVRSINEELLTVPGPGAGWGGEPPGPLFWPSLILMGIFGGYMWPSLFCRIFAASSTKQLKEATRITPFVAPVFTLLVIWVMIGAVARPEFNQGDSATALINMISSLGPVAVGLFAILILAGAISMMDSMVSSWAIVFVNDVIIPFFPNISSEKQTRICQIFSIVLGLAGLLTAMMDLPTIVQILTRVYQAVVQVFPAVIFGLYWKRGNKISAWGSVLAGFSITTYFAFTQPDYIPFLNGMQGGLFALAIGFIVYITLAFVGKPNETADQLFVDMLTPDDELVPIER